MDGTPSRAAEGGPLSVATVVIQYARVRTSRFLEAGARPPLRTGDGTALDVKTERELDDLLGSGAEVVFARSCLCFS